MRFRFWYIVVGIIVLVLGAVGCAAQFAGQPLIQPLPPPTVQSSPAASIPVPSDKMLPLALKDVTDTQVFRFRVDPSQTTVEYAVQEVLLGNNQTTVGRTNAVEGDFDLYMQNGKAFVALSNLQVDLRTLTTDTALRDQAIRKRWLESDKYPKAIFVANAVDGVPMDAVQNQPYTFKVSGDLTIRNITRPVTFDVTVTVRDNLMMGEGTSVIYMKDFGFEPPSIIGKTIVSDPVTIKLRGVAYLIDG